MNNGIDVVGNYEKYENKEYLRQCDLPETGDLIVTISRFRARVDVFDPGAKQNVEKFVIDFKEDFKPMILNKTNRETIGKVIGTKDGDKWVGHKIAIYYDPTVRLGRQVVGGLRVRNRRPAGAAYICADCGAEITGHGTRPAIEIAEGTRSTYGVTLCWDCAMKRKGASDEQ